MATYALLFHTWRWVLLLLSRSFAAVLVASVALANLGPLQSGMYAARASGVQSVPTNHLFIAAFPGAVWEARSAQVGSSAGSKGIGNDAAAVPQIIGFTNTSSPTWTFPPTWTPTPNWSPTPTWTFPPTWTGTPTVTPSGSTDI